MSQSEEPSYRSEAGRSKKRKRMVQEEEEYTGTSILQEFTQPMDFFIEPLDEEMKCIKVTNKGQEQGNLGGCKLSCTTEGESESIAVSPLSSGFSELVRDPEFKKNNVCKFV